MNTRTTIAAAALIALVAAPFAARAAGPYAVSAKLSHQGKVFAEPSAVVRNGEPASIQVTGPSGYTLALTVTELAADKIQVAAAVDSPHGRIAPTVVVRPGVPASISVGEVGLSLTVSRGGG
jgi:hypothetical protein